MPESIIQPVFRLLQGSASQGNGAAGQDESQRGRRAKDDAACRLQLQELLNRGQSWKRVEDRLSPSAGQRVGECADYAGAGIAR